MVGVFRSISNIRKRTMFGAASVAAAVSGLTLAFFEVQEWDMPSPLAIFILVLFLLMLFIALVVACYEIILGIRKYFEERATSAAWVSKEEPGLLDYEADGNRAMERFTKELLKLTTNTKKFTTKLNKYSTEFKNLNKPGKITKGIKKQKKANEVAKDIDRHAIYIEKRTKLFDALVNDITRNYTGLMMTTVVRTEEDKIAFQNFLGTLASYEKSTAGAINSVKQYRNSARNIENLNLSRTIRIASARLGNGLDNLLKTFQDSFQKSSHMRGKLDKKLR
jgi:hypothetical protein